MASLASVLRRYASKILGMTKIQRDLPCSIRHLAPAGKP